jgi:hypothetical protein
MGTVDVKKGIGPVFFGVFLALIVLVVVNNVLSSSNSGGLQVIPTVTFASSPLKFSENLGDYLDFFFKSTFGQIVSGATLVFYILATIFVQSSKDEPPTFPQVVENDIAALMRGLLIGIGSYMNLVLAENAYGTWFGNATDHSSIGLIIGLVIFGLGILASIKGIAQNSFYQGIIGWLCWLTPMAWPALLLGLALMVISIFPGGLIGLGVDFFKLGGDKNDAHDSIKGKYFTADWSTGTFFQIGGLAADANYVGTAFNMGNIGFIHRKDTEDDTEHEGGHNLSLFVFGWIFHFLGAIDEVIHTSALAERLANSHGNPRGNPTLEMWA